MKLLKKSLAVVLAFTLIFSTMSIAVHASDDYEVSFAAKFLRLNSEGKWVETTRAKPGESLMLRLYVGTNYDAGSMDLLTLYDKDYFTFSSTAGNTVNWDNEKNPDNVKKNPDVGMIKKTTVAWQPDPYDLGTVGTMYDDGVVGDTELDTLGFVANTVFISSESTPAPADISKWIVEYGPFIVNSNEYVKNADHVGKAGIPSEYLMDPVKGTWGIDIPEIPEGGVESDSILMILWEDHPPVVKSDERAQISVYSNVILNANGGNYGTDVTSKTLTGIIGDTVTGIVAPNYKKHTFKGWSKESGSTETLTETELNNLKYEYEDVTLYAVWEAAPAEQVSYKVVTTVQKPDGSYANPTTENLSGLDGAIITPATPPEGFEVVGTPSITLDSEAAETQTLNVTLDRKKYDVTYLKSDNSEAQVIPDVRFGASIPECTNYTGEAGKKLEWECQTEGAPFETMPAKDVTFKAKLTDIVYKYIFSAIDTANTLTGKFADGSATKVDEYKYNDAPSDPKTSIVPPEGYEFDTWNKTIPEKVTEDISDFEVRYKPIDYTATFTVTGAPQGTVVNPPAKVENLHKGNNITLPSLPNFVQEGYSIDGWYVNGVKTDKVAAGSQYTMPADDVEFAAIISKNSHQIVFDVNGGNSLDPMNVEFGDAVNTLPTPTIDNSEKVFDGWVDTDNDNAPVEKITSMPDKDVHLKATWKQKEYTVTYEYDGEAPVGAPAVPTDSKAYHYNDPVTVKSNPTFTGWTFSGWKLDGEVKTSFSMPKSNVTLKGSWSKNSHQIIFDVNGGNSLDPMNVEFGDAVNTLPTPTRDDWDFQGWVDTDNDNAPVEKITSMPDKDVHLKATWKQKEYTVTYEYDGEAPVGAPAVPTDSNAYHYNDPVTVKSNPTFTGWTFSGWKLDGEVKTSFSMPKSNVTLKGSWKKNGGYVNYYLAKDEHGNPIGNPIATEWVDEGAKPIGAAPETATGFNFQGWVDKDGNKLPDEMPNENINAFAIIELNKYNVVYKDADSTLIRTYENVGYGTEVPVPGDPTPPATATPDLTENIFTGWKNVRTGTVGVPKYMPDNELEFIATYQERRIGEDHTVTYIANGKTFKAYVAHYGDTVPVPDEEPTRFLAKFVGWTPEIPATMPNEDLVFTAQFENDTDIDVDDQTVIIGGAVVAGAAIAAALAVNTAIITGIAVVGGVIVIAGVTHVIKNTYTVTYKVDGEVYRTFKVLAGLKVPTPKNPSKDGVEFAGWDEAIPDKMPAHDITFNATWGNENVVNPDTGSTATGISAFAALSVATAAAYVFGRKKKEDEE